MEFLFVLHYAKINLFAFINESDRWQISLLSNKLKIESNSIEIANIHLLSNRYRENLSIFTPDEHLYTSTNVRTRVQRHKNEILGHFDIYILTAVAL